MREFRAAIDGVKVQIGIALMPVVSRLILAAARRPRHQHVVSAGRGDRERALDVLLPPESFYLNCS